tara:strand:+ start:41 stop:214 length:174 start_codon:yes stop_codon:yes gene_type:complete
MQRPSLKDLQITLRYLLSPKSATTDEAITALATIMYCQYDRTTPLELYNKIKYEVQN